MEPRQKRTSEAVARGSTPVEPQQGASPQARRRLLDLVVQNAVVELLRDYGVPAAPADPSPLPSAELGDDMVASRIPFFSPSLRGALVLCISRRIMERTSASGAADQSLHDWIRELSNQLAGRVRNRLLRYQVAFQSGSPLALEGLQLRRAATDLKTGAYAFRTLTGPVYAWLEGNLDQAALSFSTEVDVMHEGDVVLF